MCLSKLEKFKPCTVGYKVMREKDRKLYPEFCGPETPRPIGMWLNEKDFRRSSGDALIFITEGKSRGLTYQKGWHIFNKKSDAKYWADPINFGSLNESTVVVRVIVRGAVATGYDSIRKVTVAKEIKIIGKV